MCLKRHIIMNQNSRSWDRFAKNKREEWPASVAQLVERAPYVRRLWCPYCSVTCGPETTCDLSSLHHHISCYPVI